MEQISKTHFIPWRVDMLYEIEPRLAEIAAEAKSQRRSRARDRWRAYGRAKHRAWYLVGWCARDPRLRNSGAWDCYIRHITRALNI